MQLDNDNRDLAELFSRAARIPRAKIDEAVAENSILEVIHNPYLIKGATPSEIRRVEDLVTFQNLYDSVMSLDKMKSQIKGPRDAYLYLSPEMRTLPFERVDMLVLNTRGRVIKRQTVCEGSLNSCSIPAQKILRTALLYNGVSVILAHNHPSGDSKPSADDISSTMHILEAAKQVGIMLADHIVIGKYDYTSMEEEGLFEQKKEKCTLVGNPVVVMDGSQGAREEKEVKARLAELGDQLYLKNSNGEVIWPAEVLNAFNEKELEICKRIVFSEDTPAPAQQKSGGRGR